MLVRLFPRAVSVGERMRDVLGRNMRRIVGVALALAVAMTSLVAASGAAEATTVAALRSSVAVDKDHSSLAVSLTSIGPSGGFKSVFKSPHKFAKRVVSLQRWDVAANRWVQDAWTKMASNGEAVFKTPPVPGASYRAVADKFTYTSKGKKRTVYPVATPSVDVPATTRYYKFSSLTDDWADRNPGSYAAGGRRCAAPHKDFDSISSGKVVLKVGKETSSTVRNRVVAAARAAQKADNQKQVGCPYGVFRNAMISTQGKFAVKIGSTVSARVKFPLGQGMHAGVWLQSPDSNEIDIVESYGYGKGVTSGAHIAGKAYSYAVAASKTKSKSWWSSYHTVTARWTATQLRVWIDGSVVLNRNLTQPKPDAEYFLVLSLLSSDWELGRMTKPSTKGFKGVKKTDLKAANSRFYVDWVKVWAA